MVGVTSGESVATAVAVGVDVPSPGGSVGGGGAVLVRRAVGVAPGRPVTVGFSTGVGVEAVSTTSGAYPQYGPMGGTVGGGGSVGFGSLAMISGKTSATDAPLKASDSSTTSNKTAASPPNEIRDVFIVITSS